MDLSRTVQLSANSAHDECSVQLAYNHHGDIQLGVRNTEATPPSNFNKVYGMSHGSEVRLFAGMIGYLTRCGMSESELQRNVVSSAESLIKDKGGVYESLDQLDALDIAYGELCSSADRTELDWACLVSPMPRYPGAGIENATALFTMPTDSNTIHLIIARVVEFGENIAHTETERASATFLAPDDVLPLARMLSEMAMGDYRKDMRLLVGERFSLLTG